MSALARAGQGSRDRAHTGPCLSASARRRAWGPSGPELLRRRPHPQHPGHRASQGGHQSSPSSATGAPGGWQPSPPRVLVPTVSRVPDRSPLSSRPSPTRTGGLPEQSGRLHQALRQMMAGRPQGLQLTPREPATPSPRAPSAPLGRPGPQGEPLRDRRWTGSSARIRQETCPRPEGPSAHLHTFTFLKLYCVGC